MATRSTSNVFVGAEKRGRLLTDADFKRIFKRAYEGFDGNFNELTEAVGVLVIGQHVGWKAVRLAYTRGRLNKFARILGVDLEDVMPFQTDDSDRLRGVRIADQMERWYEVLTKPKHRIWKQMRAP